MKKKITKEAKGITMVALVVTIIILLILVGITISILMADNGLINRAKDAKIKNEIAKIKEEIQTEILGKQAENNGNISDETLKEILEKYGVLSKEEKLIDRILNTTKGNYEIKVSDIFNGTTIKDEPLKPYVLSETIRGANSPDISGFACETTHYVTWKKTAPYQMEELNRTNTIDKAPPTEWSNYTNKQWANIVTSGGGNECYWVWIPRYAYCITEGYHTNTAKAIDIKFLQGTTNTPIDGSNIEIKSQTGNGDWNVHPAFTNAGNGGFGELTGIWVAKFEASSNASNVVENPTEEQLKIDGGSDIDTDLKVRVKPNVTSWRGITVNNIFTVCRNLTTNGNSLEGATGIDSHMMKNTEWGAIAYLSMSIYGKNSEVWNNPYYNNTTNYSPITGLCSNESNGKDAATMEINKTCKYNEAGGGNASTTGNVYGVYDMAGGAWEITAGYLSEIAANNNYTTLANADSKYKDVYLGNSNNRSTNYNANTRKYGDAVYETSSSGNSDTGSWNSSYAYFLDSGAPIFGFGGIACHGSFAGVFAYLNTSGEAFTSNSFRPVVLSSQL